MINLLSFYSAQGGNWHCLHIDDLRATDRPLPPITLLQSHTPAQLIMASAFPGNQQQLNVNTNNAANEDLMSWEEVAEREENRDPEQVGGDFIPCGSLMKKLQSFTRLAFLSVLEDLTPFLKSEST